MFVATVDLVDEQGIRHGGHELRGQSCDELLDAVALAVAISIDPQLLLASPRPPEAAPPPKDVAAPTPAVAPVIEQETPSAPPERPVVATLPRATAPTPPPASQLTLEGSLGAAAACPRRLPQVRPEALARSSAGACSQVRGPPRRLFERWGLGTLILEAYASRDLPVLEGAVVASGGIFVVVQTVAVAAQAALDPRVRR